MSKVFTPYSGTSGFRKLINTKRYFVISVHVFKPLYRLNRKCDTCGFCLFRLFKYFFLCFSSTRRGSIGTIPKMKTNRRGLVHLVRFLTIFFWLCNWLALYTHSLSQSYIHLKIFFCFIIWENKNVNLSWTNKLNKKQSWCIRFFYVLCDKFVCEPCFFPPLSYFKIAWVFCE